MMDYGALAAVAEVARTGSFEAAAARLGVTPSAISQRVKGLEERLGAPLIVRGSPCTVTAAGARLYAHFATVAVLEHDLLAAVPGWSDAAGGPITSLRIAVNADSLATWFADAAGRFARRSDATLDLLLDDEAHTAERLRSGEVLAAVTTAGQPVQGCRTAPLGKLRYIATASPQYGARHLAGGLTPRTLAKSPMLRFDPRDHLQHRWMRLAVGEAVDAPTHWAPSTQGFLDLTLAGLGWSLTPEPLALPLLAAGRLVDLDPQVRVEVPLYWQHLRLASRLIDDLTAAVRSAAADHLVRDAA